MTDFLQVENEKIVRNSSGNEEQRNMLRGESSSPPPIVAPLIGIISAFLHPVGIIVQT